MCEAQYISSKAAGRRIYNIFFIKYPGFKYCNVFQYINIKIDMDMDMGTGMGITMDIDMCKDMNMNKGMKTNRFMI